MKKNLVFITLFFAAISALVSADNSLPGDWKGYASINGTIAPDAAPVSAHLDGSSSAAASTTVGAVEASTGYYLIHVPGPGTNVTFKICGITAYPSNETPQTWSAGLHPQGSSPYYNISVNKQANGASCTYACGCTGGYCNSNVCASSAPAADTGTSTGGTTGSTSSGTTTPAATTAPAAETPKEEKVSEKVTDAKTVNEIISVIAPSDLGVAELDSSKVEITKTSTVSQTITTDADKIEAALKDENVVKEETAKQAIGEIKSEVSSSPVQPVSVSSRLEVFSVSSKETNKSMSVSKITLTVKADKDMKDVRIVEVIPKTVALKASDISFTVAPIILQSDPIVQWKFDSMKEGETKDLSYSVKKSLSSISATTLASAQAEQPALPPVEQGAEKTETPAAATGLTAVYVLVAAILAIGIAFYFSRKSGKKNYQFKNQFKRK